MIDYTVRQDGDGYWIISRMGCQVAVEPKLGSAISRARAAAKEEHLRSGTVTHVQMQSAETAIRLALFGELDASIA